MEGWKELKQRLPAGSLLTQEGLEYREGSVPGSV